MNRVILGAIGALMLASLGLFWWQGKAEVEALAPADPPPSVAAPGAMDIPSISGADLQAVSGPDLPVASELSREQRRFARYDRNSDGRISRTEMLSTRTSAFRKLDKDGNNLLTFEEWAHTTVDKFDTADANHDHFLTPQEFRTTAVHHTSRPALKTKISCKG